MHILHKRGGEQSLPLFCVYIYYANYIIISFKHFNNSIKIKSIDQWEVWFGEQAPRGGNSFVQKINLKKRLFVHLYIHISVVGNIISSATLEDLIADLDEDDEFVEIIKNLNINDTYTSEEASGEVYIRVSYAH